MRAARSFADSNVLLYLLSSDSDKANRAEAIVGSGPIISVQVLNEVANVARRKLRMPWAEIHEFLATVRAICPCQSVTIETHEGGLQLAERYEFSIYDAMIAASALHAECKTLYSEDLQDGLLIDKCMRVLNPFRQ